MLPESQNQGVKKQDAMMLFAQRLFHLTVFMISVEHANT